MQPSTIGVLTSGGDAPGMNTAIRAVVRSAAADDIDVIGIEEGFSGLIRGAMRPLTRRDVGDILQRGGTFLQAARCPEMMTDEGVDLAVRQAHKYGLETRSSRARSRISRPGLTLLTAPTAAGKLCESSTSRRSIWCCSTCTCPEWTDTAWPKTS